MPYHGREKPDNENLDPGWPRHDRTEQLEIGLFVSETEMYRRLGVGPKAGRIAVRALEPHGFPLKQPLFGDKRYWPAVRHFLERYYGLLGERALQPATDRPRPPPAKWKLTPTEAPDAVVPLLTLKEVAAALSVSPQWLKYWLVANPVDTAGLPLYVRMGRRLKFEPNDVDRIIAHLHKLEAARLGPSIMSKARLAGLMEQVGGYDHLVAVREAAERRKAAARGPAPKSLLTELAASNVLGSRPPRKPSEKRVRLPRLPRGKRPAG